MVRFSQVGLRYPDPVRGGAGPGGAAGRETLRDLSFTLPQGSFTWLTGPSGAGKTSVLRIMQLALRPTRGEVEVLGVPLSSARRADLPKLRRRIGAVFQEFRLLPYLTAFDNVALPLRLAGRPEAGLRPDVTEMLRWVGLEGREGALPPQLSGGEQQRVAIARAVVTRPALLVADEPTGNLDAAQARRLMLLLAEMNRLGSTVVVATHSRDLIAQHPGHVMALEAGRIVSLEPWPHAREAGWEDEGGDAASWDAPGPSAGVRGRAGAAGLADGSDLGRDGEPGAALDAGRARAGGSGPGLVGTVHAGPTDPGRGDLPAAAAYTGDAGFGDPGSGDPPGAADTNDAKRDEADRDDADLGDPDASGPNLGDLGRDDSDLGQFVVEAGRAERLRRGLRSIWPAARPPGDDRRG